MDNRITLDDKEKANEWLSECCKRIQYLLEMIGWEQNITFCDTDKKGDPSTIAQYHMSDSGRRLKIEIFKPFFSLLEVDAQVRAIIHEHCHGLMDLYSSTMEEVCSVYLNSNEKKAVEKITHISEEHVVDQLEQVIFNYYKIEWPTQKSKKPKRVRTKRRQGRLSNSSKTQSTKNC